VHSLSRATRALLTVLMGIADVTVALLQQRPFGLMATG